MSPAAVAGECCGGEGVMIAGVAAWESVLTLQLAACRYWPSCSVLFLYLNAYIDVLRAAILVNCKPDVCRTQSGSAGCRLRQWDG